MNCTIDNYQLVLCYFQLPCHCHHYESKKYDLSSWSSMLTSTNAIDDMSPNSAVFSIVMSFSKFWRLTHYCCHLWSHMEIDACQQHSCWLDLKDQAVLIFFCTFSLCKVTYLPGTSVKMRNKCN